MGIDPNTVIDDAGKVVKEAVAAKKPFWKSKTFWANTITIGAGYFGYLPPAVSAVAVAGANIALRLLTKTGISFTKQ